MSKIEWTEKTWNPISGCSRISEGCANCYSEKMTKRLEAMGQQKYTGLLNEQGRFNSVIKFDEKALMIPLKTKKPTTYFVNSMSDLFHENVKDEWIDKIFAVMALCPQHTFQVLTKRAYRMKVYFAKRMASFGEEIYDEMEFLRLGFALKSAAPRFVKLPLKNCWLGVSVENQKAADERLPLLLETPAAIRWLSCEPLLERLELHNYFYTRYEMSGLHHETNAIDWVVVGGESGHGARECNLDWIYSIVQQCKSANTPVFVKQLGAKINTGNFGFTTKEPFVITNKKGADINEFPTDLRIQHFPEV